MVRILLLPFLLVYLYGCAQQRRTTVTDTEAIAFPGAEGYGRWATGGRGGTVYKVTNLHDEGEGSLRWALNKKGPRIIVFDVSGTIHLTSPLSIKSNTTMAGQTAPGDGICIADHPVKLDGDNIIVRYLRFRMGDRYQDQGKTVGAGHDDALSAIGKKHILLDHCSLSWSTDEVLSVYNGDSTTIQWCIISEPLNYSYHFEKGDSDFQHHGYGGIWGGRRLTAHHNLFAHCLSRNPRFAGTRSAAEELVDYRNNVVYNWGNNNVYGGEGGNYNLVNNYFKWGPSTAKNVRYRVVNPSRTETISFGRYYVAGNFVDGAEEVSQNNRLGVHMGNGGTEGDKDAALLAAPFSTAPVTTQPATEAFEAVLLLAGASFKRDTLDQRIIKEVKTRTGRIIDVQGGHPHGTPYDISKKAWPALAALPAAPDTDGDGMPDQWELQQGLNARDAGDASRTSLHKHFTNIEVYINSIVK